MTIIVRGINSMFWLQLRAAILKLKKTTKTKYTLGRNKTANMPPGLQGTLDPNEKVP